MKFKKVMRWDETQRLYRVGRLMWKRGQVGVPGGGYSAKLSLALAPKWFFFHLEACGWILAIVGVRVHFAKSYGGKHV